MLIYAAKRIHYGDDTYNMRMELAVLDWVTKLCCPFYIISFIVIIYNYAFLAYINLFVLQNENVNREASSLQMYRHSRHPNCMAETRVLVAKTFKFRETIWSSFFNLNM